jgi:ribosome-binding protein aMBF1 (putative translation factor)
MMHMMHHTCLFCTFCLQTIQAQRLALGLTQKDIAQRINEKPTVIQDYESGKAIPSPQILGKLEKILGVKLRGESRLFEHHINHRV